MNTFSHHTKSKGASLWGLVCSSVLGGQHWIAHNREALLFIILWSDILALFNHPYVDILKNVSAVFVHSRKDNGFQNFQAPKNVAYMTQLLYSMLYMIFIFKTLINVGIQTLHQICRYKSSWCLVTWCARANEFWW